MRQRLLKLWIRFGELLGMVVSPVVLGLIYLVLVVPVALLKRLTGDVRLARRLDRDAATYRTAPRPSERMEDPF